MGDVINFSERAGRSAPRAEESPRSNESRSGEAAEIIALDDVRRRRNKSELDAWCEKASDSVMNLFEALPEEYQNRLMARLQLAWIPEAWVETDPQGQPLWDGEDDIPF